MRNLTGLSAFAAILSAAAPLQAPTPKPASISAYACYIQSAEGRMAARAAFLLVDGDASRRAAVLKDKKIVTTPGSATNPQKIPGAMIFDWVGTVFIPGASLQRTIRMLQDYDHRAEYFADVVTSSRLFCSVGASRFGFRMVIKEP